MERSSSLPWVYSQDARTLKRGSRSTLLPVRSALAVSLRAMADREDLNRVIAIVEAYAIIGRMRNAACWSMARRSALARGVQAIFLATVSDLGRSFQAEAECEPGVGNLPR